MSRFPPHFLDDVRGRVPISTLIGSHVTWDRRKTNASRGDYWACCPFHAEKKPSFHCEDRKGRYHCFGCGASGDHFKFLTEHVGLRFPDAVAEVASLAGLPLPNHESTFTDEQKREYAQRKAAHEKAIADRQRQAEQDRAEKTLSAKQIWQQTEDFAGSLAETYLEWRCPGLSRTVGPHIRFHPALDLNPEKPRGDRWPALIAKVTDAGGVGCAIWRIYLAHDGRGKMPVADGFSAKMGYGAAAGGAVRLGGMAEHIGLCEGVETSRAIIELGAKIPVWPALSTSGIIGFQIPAGVKRITLFPDPDGRKLKTKFKQDGTRFIAQPPGREACQKFIERNPGFPIDIAEAARDADYLEVLQKIRGVPLR